MVSCSFSEELFGRLVVKKLSRAASPLPQHRPTRKLQRARSSSAGTLFFLSFLFLILKSSFFQSSLFRLRSSMSSLVFNVLNFCCQFLFENKMFYKKNFFNLFLRGSQKMRLKSEENQNYVTTTEFSRSLHQLKQKLRDNFAKRFAALESLSSLLDCFSFRTVHKRRHAFRAKLDRFRQGR